MMLNRIVKTCLTLPYLISGVGRLLHLLSAEAVSARPNAHPECNYKVTGNGYKAVDFCEAVNRRARPWSGNQHKSTGNV